MFRRRPVRRIPVGGVPPALQQAARLMASGQYGPAAEIYERFADGALARGGPRAPWFFLQAGQARLLEGQVPWGMRHVMQGLQLLAARRQLQRLYHAGKRISAELTARGLSDQARQVDDYLASALPAGFVPQSAGGAAGSAAGSHPVLPVSCPACGGPIRSDEVEWVDPVTAECPYCGGAVRAQSGS
jgi:hypothetical protein